MRKFNALIVVLCSLLFSLGSEMQQTYFKMTKIACTDTNESLAAVEICRLKAVKRDVTEATVKYRLKKRIDKLNVHVELLRKYNHYEPFGINTTLNVCKFFKNQQKSYLRILYNLIEKYTSANHTCPYENEIFIDRFRPEYDRLMLPLPSADYSILFGLYTPNTLITNLKVWFTFREIDYGKRLLLGGGGKKKN